MKRSTPLTADRDKTLAWQARSRVKAAQNARERRDRQQRDAKAPETAGERPLPPVRFKARVPAHKRLCVRCEAVGRERRASCWHHWVAQEFIRIYVRGLRLRDEQAERDLLRDLLRDERNLSPFCAAHHGSHGTTAHEFTADEVPPSAFTFAAELGAEYVERLRRMYPEQRGHLGDA